MKHFLFRTCVTAMAVMSFWQVSAFEADAQIQRPRRLSLGLYGFYSLDMNTVSFLDLPNVPVFTPRTGGPNEPGPFQGGTTGNPGVGILLEYAITDQFTVGLRANYAPQNARLTTFSTYPVGRLDGTSADGRSDYSIDATVQTIGLEPLVMVNVWEGLNVFVGARLGLVVGTSYSQRETLAAPSDGGFDTSARRVRNETSGALPNVAGLTVAPFGGLSYTIPLSDRFAIVPEVSYSLGIMNVVTDTKWTVSSLRPTLALKYKL
jgi:hypothetical protein